MEEVTEEVKEQKFKAIFTPRGKQIALAAYTGGKSVNLKYMGVGDSEGFTYIDEEGNEQAEIPHPDQTKLRNRWARIELNKLKVDEENPFWLVAEGVLPEEVGGRWVREISLIDENNKTITIANWPATYKPLLSEGGSTAMVLRSTLEVSDTEVFNLEINKTLAVVAQDDFDNHVKQTTDVHGSSVAPTPNSLAQRDANGRLQAAKPVAADEVARLKEVSDLIALIEQAGDSGVPLWTTWEGNGTKTSFNLMGLKRDLNYAVMVFLDGVKQVGDGTVYTIDLEGEVSTVNFAVAPPQGVLIEFLTVVALTQYPYATTCQAGVVKLAESLEEENEDAVVTVRVVKDLESGLNSVTSQIPLGADIATTALNATVTQGTATTFARSDHRHAIPTIPTVPGWGGAGGALTSGTAGAAGSATTMSRSDHTHTLPAIPTIVDATTTTKGVVRLATDLNDNDTNDVVTIGNLRGPQFNLKSSFTNWEVGLSNEAKIKLSGEAEINMNQNAKLNISNHNSSIDVIGSAKIDLAGIGTLINMRDGSTIETKKGFISITA